MDKTALFIYSDYFSDTGIYEELFISCQYPWEVLPKIDDFIIKFRTLPAFSEYKEISNNVFIGKNVQIDSDSRIEGPAIIGSNTTLRYGSYLRENCLIGENVIIGHAVEMKQSIVMSNSSVSHLSYVGNCILGKNVRIAGGAILANTRLDLKEVTIRDGENRIGVGVNKFGCIIGDNSFIGANAVTNPGTILSKDTKVFPLVAVWGVHNPGETIK